MTPLEESKFSSFDLRLAQWDEQCAQGDTPPDGIDTSRWQATRRVLDQLNAAFREFALPSSALSESTEKARFGRFILHRELGRGGFGIVFLADDPQLGRQVALKIPRLNLVLDEEARQRFLHEGRAAATLDHPNIVAVHEAGEIGPVAYLAMAYYPGLSLGEWLKRCAEPMDPRQAAELVAALADGMQHAHSRGVLHRDLKPGNVLLSRVSDHESEHREQLSEQMAPDTSRLTPRISDFGLARRLDHPSQTQTGAVLGTPAYMAPEQAAGRTRDVGTHSDIYALGAILYELLCGRPPFEGSGAEMIVRVQQEEAIPLRKLRPHVPRDLETICQKCLTKEPGGRYASAGALADDLRRFSAGESIAARASPVGVRLLRWARRKPALAGSLSLLAVTLLIAGGTAGWGIWKYTADLKTASEIAEGHRREADRQKKVVLDNLRATFGEIIALESRRPDLHDVRQDLLLRLQQQLLSIVDDQAHLALADETNFWLELEVGDVYRDNDQNLIEAHRHYLRAQSIAETVRIQPGGERDGKRLFSYAISRLGDIHKARGEWAQAERCFDEMFALRQAAFAERADRDSRQDLAVGHLKVGDFFADKPRDAGPPDPVSTAEAHFTACRDLYQALANEFPDSLDYARMLGHSWDRLADRQRDYRKSARAIELLQTALAVRRTARSRFPGCEVAFEFDCCYTLDRLREVFFAIGDYDRAKAANREAQPMRLDLAAHNPRSSEMLWHAAQSHQSMGEIHLCLGQYALAIADFEASCVMHQKWAALQPIDSNRRTRLISAFHGVVRASYFADGRDERTVPYFKERIAKQRENFASEQGTRNDARLVFNQLLELGDFHLCVGRAAEAARLYDEARQFRNEAEAMGDELAGEDVEPLELRGRLIARAADVEFDPFAELAGAVRDREFLLWMQRELFARRNAQGLATVSGRLADLPDDTPATYAAAACGFAQAAELAQPGVERTNCDRRCEELIARLLKFSDASAERVRSEPLFARYSHVWSESK